MSLLSRTVSENKVDSVERKGNTVILNGSKEFTFKHVQVASSFAEKLSWFIGI